MKVVIFETIRRHFKNTTFLIFLVVLCGLALLIGGYGGPLRVWQGLLSATVLLLSCQLIGPEFSSGTLQLILAKPVRRDSYLLGRVAGVVAVVWTAALAASIADAMGRLMSRASDVPWSEVAASEVNLGLSVVIVCALMAFFGSFTRSYLNIALYFGIQITLSFAEAALRTLKLALNGRFAPVGLYLRNHDFLERALSAVSANLFPGQPAAFDLPFALLIAGNAAVALYAACVIFSRREVPYAAD